MALTTICTYNCANASILLKARSDDDNSSEFDITMIDEISIPESGLIRRASHDKKGDDSSSGSGSSSDNQSGNRGPKLPPQPRKQIQVVRPEHVEKVISDDVWKGVYPQIQQKVKDHVNQKKGGNGSGSSSQ